MRRLVVPFALAAFAGLAACETILPIVAPVVVPADVQAATAALTCSEASHAFGDAAAALAVAGATEVINGGFDHIVEVAQAVATGQVTEADAAEVGAALYVLALNARLQSCPPIEVAVRPT